MVSCESRKAKAAMPQTCSAAGCKSRKDKDCKKSFYRIPVDRGQREQWVAAINRKDWTPTPYSRICSDHFVLGESNCTRYGKIEIYSTVDLIVYVARETRVPAPSAYNVRGDPYM